MVVSEFFKLHSWFKTLAGCVNSFETLCLFRQTFVKQQSFITHEHFNGELKRLRGAIEQVNAPCQCVYVHDLCRSIVIPA